MTRLPLLILFGVVLSPVESCTRGSVGAAETGWWNEECPETPTCTAHACAAQDGDAGIACCLASEGRGLDGDAAQELARACDPERMSCDPGDYVSEAAAVCIAQVAGLATGNGSCGGHFSVDGAEGAARWMILNELGPNCSEGDCVELDAVTGAFDAGDACAWAD